MRRRDTGPSAGPIDIIDPVSRARSRAVGCVCEEMNLKIANSLLTCFFVTCIVADTISHGNPKKGPTCVGPKRLLALMTNPADVMSWRIADAHSCWELAAPMPSSKNIIVLHPFARQCLTRTLHTFVNTNDAVHKPKGKDANIKYLGTPSLQGHEKPKYLRNAGSISILWYAL